MVGVKPLDGSLATVSTPEKGENAPAAGKDTKLRSDVVIELQEKKREKHCENELPVDLRIQLDCLALLDTSNQYPILNLLYWSLLLFPCLFRQVFLFLDLVRYFLFILSPICFRLQLLKALGENY